MLLRSIGFVDTLERPEKIIDVPLTVQIFVDNKRDGLIAKAKLRSAAEILDAADLIYRYHWAVTMRDSDVRPRLPASTVALSWSGTTH